MNDDTPMISTKTPLITPTTAAHRSARIRQATSGSPASLNW